MSLLKATSVQIGQSNTATNNFTLTAQAQDGTIKLARGNSGATTSDILSVANDGRLSFNKPPTGSVLQVVQTVKADTFSTTTSGSNQYVSITGLSASITPSSASNKILVLVELGGSGMGSFSTLCSFKVQRAGADISGMLGTARTNFFQTTAANLRASHDTNSAFRANMTYLDSPSSTSSLTYQVLGQAEFNGFCINRTSNDQASANYSATSISTITLIEVAG